MSDDMLMMNATECASDIYYNNTDETVFIVLQWRASDDGVGPGIPEKTLSIGPGQGIDLKVLGFSREKK